MKRKGWWLASAAFVCSAGPVRALATPAFGTICSVEAHPDVIIIERNADGAERLTLTAETYFLRYDGRVYLSKSKRSQTQVIDMTSHVDTEAYDRTVLTPSTAISNIHQYLQLADKAYPDKRGADKYASLSVATCVSAPIAPERFTLRSLPVDAPPQRP